ncbi:asparagine synthase-related protein [Laceyella tengchongensis]
MRFYQTIYGSVNDSQTSIQLQGWIWKARSVSMKKFLDDLLNNNSDSVQDLFESWMENPTYSFLKDLDGAFILSYWNKDKREGLIYKSLLCKSSLYYKTEPLLSWSTNPLLILKNGISPVLQVDKQNLLITYLGDPIPHNLSHFRGVYRLPAGHVIHFKNEGLEIEQVDFIQSQPLLRNKSYDYLAQTAKEIMIQTVKERWNGEKIGVILSGGLDSCVALACFDECKVPVVGFHWTFDGIPAADESNYARLVTDHLKVPLKEIKTSSTVEDGTYLNHYWNLPVPYAHGFYRFFELVAEECEKEGISLCSSGYFGDTIFGPGEDWDVNWTTVFSSLSLNRAIRYLWESVGTPYVKTEKANHPRYLWYKHFLSKGSNKMIDGGIITADRRSVNNKEEIFYRSFDNETDAVLENGLFAKHNISLFHLFASRELMEFSLRIPLPYRIIPSGGQWYPKPLLRLAWKEQLPEQVLHRNHRQVMGAFIEKCILQNKEQVENYLGKDSFLALFQIIDPEKISELVKKPKLLTQSAIGLNICLMVEFWLRYLANWKGEERDAIPSFSTV